MFFEGFRKYNNKIIVPKNNINNNNSISKIKIKNNDYENIRNIVISDNEQKMEKLDNKKESIKKNNFKIA
jgi:hypothetical protein